MSSNNSNDTRIEDMTRPKPLGVKVHNAACDAQMDVRMMTQLLRRMMKHASDTDTLLSLMADAQEYAESAQANLSTVITNTGRGKSE